MIVDYKCDSCELASICNAKTKLKPFTEDAKVDLGVMLRMAECTNFRDIQEVEPQVGIDLEVTEEND